MDDQRSDGDERKIPSPEVPVAGSWGDTHQWDVFLAAYTSADRASCVFDKVNASRKYSLVFPEYCYDPKKYPACEAKFFDYGDTWHEGDYIRAFWDTLDDDVSNARICIDVTGFVRPYLLFLVRWLHELGIRTFDALYSEPDHYEKREKTVFSDAQIEEIRQVAGLEGIHVSNDSTDAKDVLIMGPGYESHLIARVAENKISAKKIQPFGFPPLRADMYQENMLKVKSAEEAIDARAGDDAMSYFAPANAPFVTASVLSGIVKDLNDQEPVANLYLAPMATKAQVLGFALYYVTERRELSLIRSAGPRKACN